LDLASVSLEVSHGRLKSLDLEHQLLKALGVLLLERFVDVGIARMAEQAANALLARALRAATTVIVVDRPISILGTRIVGPAVATASALRREKSIEGFVREAHEQALGRATCDASLG
jgi:hypothetical protein